MAIDLATSLSPYEYQNMLPLDVLAAVASETLKNEIHSTDNPEVKTSNSLKKQIKKSTASVLTLDDIRTLPVKSLVDKFSEMTSDELTKKYSYKCFLLPHKCTMTFKSFGNEKKACDKIKSHLMSHVEQLILEFESNKEVSETIFVPVSPNSTSKHTEKLSKKSVKKQQTSLNNGLSRANSFKVSKKEKSSELLVKKAKKKLNSNKKCVTEFKKCFGKANTKMFSSVYLKKSPCTEDSNDESILSDNELVRKNFEEEVLDEKDIGWENEYYYSNYSKHLKYIFFSNDAAKEKLSESDSEQISDSNYCDNSLDESYTSSIPDTIENSDKPFLHDHNYACYNEVKRDKLLTSELKSLSRVIYEDPFLQQQNVQTQLVIRTPPFPFVHTPLLPEVAEIKEIGVVECHCGADECSNFSSYLSDDGKVKNEPEEMQTDEQASDYEEKYSASVFYKMNGASSSVLECVENIVNKKHSNSCVPKNEISASENDENLENMQKFEKELALKYIAKLHSKGKKKIPDSLICQICPDKHFTAQATLIHHYRSHAGIKPYICEICSAKFTRQHSLNYHMLIHENRSRFTCEFCGRTFRHPSHYKEHLRRHTGETPYHCTDCNLHFKTRNTFKRHLKTRHGKLLTAGGIEDLNAD